MGSPIRILFTTSNFDTAGSGKVIYDLIKGLDRSQFAIEIACGSDKGAFFKTIASLGVPIHVFPTKTAYRPYYSLLFRAWEIAKFYKQQQYDLIHSWQWSNDWTEALAARMAGVRWMYTKKAMGYSSKHWYIKSYLADYIVTINEEMRGYFPNKKQQQLIPLGLDTNYYSPEQYHRKRENCVFQVVTVANLVPVKGLEVLLAAIQTFSSQEVHLTVVGKDDTTYGVAMKAEVKRLGLEAQVQFVGKQIDVRPYLAGADLYVIPTLDEGRKEGMPMALVEAMSMGIPVLGSDITGINFVLKDFPQCRFKAGDVTALVEAIKELRALSAQDRLVLGTALRRYCEAHFSMDSFIGSHEKLYCKLATKLIE